MDANDIFILNTAAEMMGSFLGRIRAETEIRSLLDEKSCCSARSTTASRYMVTIS